MSNPNDEIRNDLLRFLHERHTNARSPRSAGIGIRDLSKVMRERRGYKQQQVGSNLDYLIQKGWAVEVIEPRSFETERGTRMPSNKVTYKISDVGIDKLQAASVFQRSPKDAISITNIRGVTVVGDGNVVNTTYTDLSRELEVLREGVLASTRLDDEAKLNIVSDVDGLQNQLQKPEPDKSIVDRLWTSIEKTLAGAGLIELGIKVGTLIGPLLD